MPGKVNPVMAEMLNMAMYHVQGCDLTVSLASQAGQLELNVMMPIIAHNLFEMMQVMIGAITTFTQKCVIGLQANRIKAEGWLARNAIIATALNPLIGYSVSAILVKQAMERNMTIREIALEKVSAGELSHIQDGHLITIEEIDLAIKDLKRLTYGGIAGH
jgi:fumarate hydratase class II